MPIKLQTPVECSPSPHKIDWQSPLLLVGSCFSDEIGKLLDVNHFKTLINPFGVIFNPLTLVDLLQTCIHKQVLPATTFDYRADLHFNYWLHSSFSNPSATALQQQIALQQQKIREYFLETHTTNSRFLLLTMGTAWVYELQNPRLLVANCHKMPANRFQKRLLSVAEIVDSIKKLYTFLPIDTQLVLTVSPIRHLKDTLPLNAVSKATLRLACHELCQTLDRVQYFPSYELITDELRDYRFYEADMLHPTKQTVQFIFDKFCSCFLSPAHQQILAQWQKINTRLQHRPLHPNTTNYREFLQNLLTDLEKMTEINLQKEIEQVRLALSCVATIKETSET